MNIKLSFLSLGLALCLGACSSGTPEAESPADGASDPAAPSSEETPAAGGECAEHAAASPEHCECQGGFVRGDIGDGKVKCEDDETDLGRVNQGIEGAVCCKKN